MIRFVAILLLFPALISCNGKRQEATANLEQPLNSLPKFEEHIKSIPSTFLQPQNCRLPVINQDSLDPVAALKVLFPGTFYPDYDQRHENVVAWNCPDCKGRNVLCFNSDEREFSIPFPDEKRNLTSIVGQLRYRRDSTQHEAVFFSTTDNQYWVGRFNPAYLGISVWKKERDFWILEAFNPAVICNGSFSEALAPDSVVSIGPQTLAFLSADLHPTAAGIGETYQNIFMYSASAPMPKLIFYDLDVRCSVPDEELTHWDTEMRWLKGNKSMYDLELISYGHLEEESLRDYWHSQKNTWMAEIVRNFRRSGKSEFHLTRRFRFNGARYVRN